jgi:hypothetical protein
MEFMCCVCRAIVESNTQDWYSLQVRHSGAGKPEMIWVHGPCLREIMPIVEEEMP